MTNDIRAKLLVEEIRRVKLGVKPSILARIYPAMDHGPNNPPADTTPCSVPEVDHDDEEQDVEKASKDKQETLSAFAKRCVKALVDDTTSWFPPTSTLVPDEPTDNLTGQALLKIAAKQPPEAGDEKKAPDKSKFLKRMQQPAGHE